ncbi:hypothetical protein SFR_5213 [Streptomyces sp. FR-008]|nr:hypothetical protein SFR_5213 [Streptomyces sp. FR-008]
MRVTRSPAGRGKGRPLAGTPAVTCADEADVASADWAGAGL